MAKWDMIHDFRGKLSRAFHMISQHVDKWDNIYDFRDKLSRFFHILSQHADRWDTIRDFRDKLSRSFHILSQHADRWDTIRDFRDKLPPRISYCIPPAFYRQTAQKQRPPRLLEAALCINKLNDYFVPNKHASVRNAHKPQFEYLIKLHYSQTVNGRT